MIVQTRKLPLIAALTALLSGAALLPAAAAPRAPLMLMPLAQQTDAAPEALVQIDHKRDHHRPPGHDRGKARWKQDRHEHRDRARAPRRDEARAYQEGYRDALRETRRVQPPVRSAAPVWGNPYARNGFNDLSLSERRAIQRRLASQGYYGGPIDGSWGPGTWNGMNAWAGSNNGYSMSTMEATLVLLQALLR